MVTPKSILTMVIVAVVIVVGISLFFFFWRGEEEFHLVPKERTKVKEGS